MSWSVRLSLANKCQLLFGGAVVLILTVALVVVAVRMDTLVSVGDEQTARMLADIWLADRTHLGHRLTRTQAAIPPEGATPPDTGHQADAMPAAGADNTAPADKTIDAARDWALALIRADQFDRVAKYDQFAARAIRKFQRRDLSEFVRSYEHADGNMRIHYARAIRENDVGVIVKSNGIEANGDTSPATSPLRGVLVIELRSRDEPVQHLINRLFLIGAGLASGLLAIGAFWLIVNKLILSPMRVLREAADQAATGDLNVRADINTRDEFEQLADVFNKTLRNLKENQDQLHLTNKSLDLKLGELSEANVSLYEANKIKGEFLANVSHELRTPLNSIVGFAQVLEETLRQRTGPVDEKRKRYARNIINSSQQLLTLINDLLDLAKIEAGRMNVNVEAISAADTAEGLVSLIRPQARQRDIDLRLKVAPNLPAINTDAGKIHQILFNFLANAIKFTPPGGRVTLDVDAITEKEDARVRFAVTDSGPGIPRDQQQAIFEKFTQLDTSMTREHRGTGLGLTISRELADLLQCEIRLDSTEGQGATFSLYIPLKLSERGAPLMPRVLV